MYPTERKRYIILGAAIGAVFLFFVVVMMLTQLRDGEDYARQAAQGISITQQTSAARGEIVDATGKAFTGNTTICNITIDSNYFTEQELNPLLLTLTALCRDYGCEWRDELPISTEMPYTFTGEEAALRAVRLGRRAVKQEDLLAAFELVIAGTEKKGSVLTEFEKKLVAYHEVGHAMVAYKQKNTEPVQKITIVPHTQGSLGYTLLMPEEDKTELRTRDELLARIAVSMGGRAAEEVVMNTMTNGAAQDIQDATSVARNMVAMYGMSDRFGMMALASKRSQYLDGGYGMDCAQDTAAALDEAVRAILDQCYAAAVQIIRDSRQEMDAVVAYLLEKETITGAEMVAIIEGRDPAAADSPLRAEATAAPAAPAEDKTEDPPAEDKPAEEPPATDTPQDPPVTLEKSQEDEPPKEKP